MIITKGNIQLRLVQLEDLDLLFDWENKPENSDFSTTKGPFSKAHIRQFIVESQDLVIHNQLRFIIYHLQHSHKPVGLIDVYDFDREIETANIGILIAVEQLKRKGIATEALSAAIEYCFEFLPLEKLTCSIHFENEKSIGLFKKCGFIFTKQTADFIELELRNNA